MPGAVTGAIDAPLEVFGGLITQMAPSDLPIGASPDCQDVAFAPGKVFTRAGLQSIFAAIAGNPTVNYLKTYITSNALLRTIALDSLGNLWREDATSAPRILGLITNIILPTARAKSTTLFGREYIAFNDGKLGLDMPRQWDDTNLDRLSCCGPSAPPVAVDENLSYTIAAAGIPGAQMVPAVGGGGAGPLISEVGNLCTLTFSASYFAGTLQVAIGDQFKITLAGVAGYDGTFTAAANATWVPG